MKTMAVHDAASQGATMAIASATASGAGSDAEIGIQRVSMDLAAAGSVNGLTNLAATATDGRWPICSNRSRLPPATPP